MLEPGRRIKPHTSGFVSSVSYSSPLNLMAALTSSSLIGCDSLFSALLESKKKYACAHAPSLGCGHSNYERLLRNECILHPHHTIFQSVDLWHSVYLFIVHDASMWQVDTSPHGHSTSCRLYICVQVLYASFNTNIKYCQATMYCVRCRVVPDRHSSLFIR